MLADKNYHCLVKGNKDIHALLFRTFSLVVNNICSGEIIRCSVVNELCALNLDELFALLDLSCEVKNYPANFVNALQGRSIATIFEKQSLRTHVTFDVGIH